MRKFLIFDTEGSGLFDYSAPAHVDGQPRLAEFAGTILEEDDEGRLLVGIDGAYHFIVRPDGWEMTPGATSVNGLTTNTCSSTASRSLVCSTGTSIADPRGLHHVRVPCAARSQDDARASCGAPAARTISSRRRTLPHALRLAQGDRHGEGRRLAQRVPEAVGRASALRDAFDDQPCLSRPGWGVRRARVFCALHKIGMLLDPEVHYAKNRPMPPAQGTFNEMDF
jgi:hypothetical protein